jgi:hypothetical protein
VGSVGGVVGDSEADFNELSLEFNAETRAGFIDTEAEVNAEFNAEISAEVSAPAFPETELGLDW